LFTRPDEAGGAGALAPCQTGPSDAIYPTTGRALNLADGEQEMASRLLRRQVMTLTDAAAARVRELTAGAGKPVAGVRVGVKNGGCAGMSYTMELAETASPLDEVVEDKGVRILIDPKAVLFLLGAQMDFKVDRLSATFAFSNPNETSACGCGESVAITPASPEALNAPA
jgi:iron-sulfur cluster assembly protein